MLSHSKSNKIIYPGIAPDRTYFNSCCAGGTIVDEPLCGETRFGRPLTTLLVSEEAYMPVLGKKKPAHIRQEVPVITIGDCALKARELKPGDVVKFFGEVIPYYVGGMNGFLYSTECLKYMAKKQARNKRDGTDLPLHSFILFAFSFSRLNELPDGDWGANCGFIASFYDAFKLELRRGDWLQRHMQVNPNFVFPDEMIKEDNTLRYCKIIKSGVNFNPDEHWPEKTLWSPDLWYDDTKQAFSKLKIVEQGRPRVNIIANEIAGRDDHFDGLFCSSIENYKELTKQTNRTLGFGFNSFSSNYAFLRMRSSPSFRSGFNIIYVLDDLAEKLREKADEFSENHQFIAEIRYFFAMADAKHYQRGPHCIGVVSSLSFGENFEHRIEAL